ncbi:MAG: DegT/DnrJ/EryC1/StrS family aminotransferase [Firmicutes bacterium]|nr:DegT/DnrJ/EryC1/StrS family aminotransferase [Bacillota bacterium]
MWLSHERLGYNYRMDELSAALGVAQMSRIEEIIAKRERVAAMYAERLARVPGVRLPYVAPEATRMSWFAYVIRVGVDEPTPERQSAVRDHVMRRLQEPTQRRRGSRFPAIGLGDGGQDARRCHPYFTSSHPQPFYRAEFGSKEGDFRVTEFAEFA